MTDKLIEIFDIDPLSPEFRRARAGKNYITPKFQKKLIIPAKEDKIFELKIVHHFKLCLIYPIIESYIRFLSERGMYKKEVEYIQNILNGVRNKEVIDITKYIPRLLPYVADNNYLTVFDTNNSKYHSEINYYAEGSYAPMAGRGYIVYEIDGFEIFRTIQWMS